VLELPAAVPGRKEEGSRSQPEQDESGIDDAMQVSAPWSVVTWSGG